MQPKTSSCSKSKPSNANEGGGGASLRTRFLSSSSCSKTPLHPKSSSKKKHLHSNSKDKDKENLNYNAPRTRNSQKPINSNIVNTNIPGKNPKKPSSKTPLFSRHRNNLTSTPLQQQQQVDVNKMPTLESSSSSADKLTKTPPVEASVSPEIIAFTSTPPASSCYGAGHVLLSGVSDMRKCRPKGLLQAAAFAGTKTNHCKLSSPYSSSSSCCLFPSPVDASIHWLSSPPSSTLETHTHTQHNLTPTPTHTHHSKSFLDLDLDLEYQTNSPFSTTHSLQPSHSGSANLIRTPDSDSDSTAATYVVDSLSLNSNNNKTMFDSQLQLITCSLAQTLRIPNSSANTIQPQLPITDTDRDRDSIPFSFRFDSFTTSSTSVFLSQGEGQLHQIPDHSHASSCNSSWTRQGPMSQIYEHDMDELDCCRCLSDDDHDDVHNHNDIFPLCDAASSDIHDAANSFSRCCSPKTLAALADGKAVGDNVGQQNRPSGVEPPHLSSSRAESISTDGGGLLTSVDSDWEV